MIHPKFDQNVFTNMENKGCSLIPWEDPHDDANIQKNDEDKEEIIT